MAYRETSIRTVVADDSNQLNKTYDRECTIYQTKDNEVCSKVVRVAPADAEATIDIGPVAAGYFIEIRSDYPILVRLNGASETQFTMRSNGVPTTNVGAPLPDQCVFMANVSVTSVRLAPISSAAQTANVRLVVTGDPTSAYV